MAMNTTYLNSVRDAAATQGDVLITHIGLLNSGTEISGGSPAYARLAVTWTQTGGLLRPSVDLDFDVPAGATINEWRGYSALTGGTDYGGATITPAVVFAAQGVFRLLAASTAITHTAVVV